MKKLIIYTICFMLSGILNLNAIGETLFEENFSGTVNDFISSGKFLFNQPFSIAISNGKLTVPPDQWSVFTPNTQFSVPYTMSANISATAGTNTSPLAGFVVGLRTQVAETTFNGQGLWIFMKDKVAYTYVDSRQNDALTISLPQSLEIEQKIYICDEGNKISVYGTQNQEIIRLFYFVYENNDLTLFASHGEKVGTIKNANLAASGYINLMPHFTISSISQLKVTKGNEVGDSFMTGYVFIPKAINNMQYIPKNGYVFDTMTFYENGELHVFFLQKSGWSHVGTRDMINFTEYPDALLPSTDELAPDRDCWTGSVFKKDDTYYLYYTGKNHKDPLGDQKVMIATSTDLINFTKRPDKTFYADGTIYWNKTVSPLPAVPNLIPESANDEAFRDPEVMFDPLENNYKMIMHARRADNGQHCFGVYQSNDLLNWTVKPPLQILNYDNYHLSNIDCPNVFEINGTWYLVYSDARYLTSNNMMGPYTGTGIFLDYDWAVPKVSIDAQGRIVATGTIRASKGFSDNGARVGAEPDSALSMVREFYQTSDGRLQTRPLSEVVNSFKYSKYKLENRTLRNNEKLSIPSPKNYMISAKIKLDSTADFEIGFRRTNGCGYDVLFNSVAQIRSAYWSTENNWPRGYTIDRTKDVDIKMFVNESIVELYVNDYVALACRIYDYNDGYIYLSSSNGQTSVKNFEVLTQTDNVAITDPFENINGSVDFSNPIDENSNWQLFESTLIENGVLKIPAPGFEAVTGGIGYKKQLSPYSEPYEMSFDLNKSTRINNDGNFVTATMLGLRQSEIDSNAISNQNIWVTFYNDSIGVQGTISQGDWGSGSIKGYSIAGSGINFANPTKIFVEDYGKVIKLYAQNTGEKVHLLNILTENISLTGDSPLHTVNCTNDLIYPTGRTISKKGFAVVWAHLVSPNAEVDNIKISEITPFKVANAIYQDQNGLETQNPTAGGMLKTVKFNVPIENAVVICGVYGENNILKSVKTIPAVSGQVQNIDLALSGAKPKDKVFVLVWNNNVVNLKPLTPKFIAEVN